MVILSASQLPASVGGRVAGTFRHHFEIVLFAAAAMKKLNALTSMRACVRVCVCVRARARAVFRVRASSCNM